MNTEFFTHEPERCSRENAHVLAPALQYMRQRIESLRNDHSELAKLLVRNLQELAALYVETHGLFQRGPTRGISPYETYDDEDVFEFTVSDRQQLVAAAKKNGFFRDLISRKPPRCFDISHEQTVLECAEHARLWLSQAKLPVYYNFRILCYSDVARGDTVTPAEQEVWESPVGFQTSMVSGLEKVLRRGTLHAISEPGEGVAYNLTPKDFDNLNVEGLCISRWLSFPVRLTEKDTPEKLADYIASAYKDLSTFDSEPYDKRFDFDDWVASQPETITWMKEIQDNLDEGNSKKKQKKATLQDNLDEGNSKKQKKRLAFPSKKKQKKKRLACIFQRREDPHRGSSELFVV